MPLSQPEGFQKMCIRDSVYRVPQKERQERIGKFADLFEIKKDLAQPIRSYSHGMKQKLALISAFIHEPELIIMDEPFVGLDPKASHHLKPVSYTHLGLLISFTSQAPSLYMEME